MKNVQVRFSDDVYEGLKKMAEEEGTTLSDVLKRSIQLYGILRAYQKEGKDLALVDKSGDSYARLVIPGITSEAPAKESIESKVQEPGQPDEKRLTPFTPAREVAEKLRGLTWPDPDFADDLEKAIHQMRVQPPSDEEEDLMGIWKGSGPQNEVEEFLDWRRSEGRRETEEFEES